MTILLIRHGLPHDIEAEAAAASAGPADPALNEEGIGQAALLAASLARGDHGTVTSIVSSPMRRARETAEPLAALTGLPIRGDERLVELDAGSSEYGRIFERFPTRAALWASVNEGRWGTHRFEPAAFAARIVAGIEDAVAADPDGVVAVFCHGGVISAYLAHVVQAARLFFFAPDYTSVTRILTQPDGYRELASVNETLHLPRVAASRKRF